MKLGILLEPGISYEIKDGVLFIDCIDGDSFKKDFDCIQLVNVMTCESTDENAVIIDLQNLRVGRDGSLHLGL